MSEYINKRTRIDLKLNKEMTKIINNEQYKSESEFIREAIIELVFKKNHDDKKNEIEEKETIDKLKLRIDKLVDSNNELVKNKQMEQVFLKEMIDKMNIYISLTSEALNIPEFDIGEDHDGQ